ncbi:hypothetical protein [Amycolatopsis benzoatilytica]|uniref:hypothetical protein n=1 Tax=Amycolatopsis benzoatilytica TaxID=346045 RepID=UPI0003647F8E|nr:hypothetical protein [Amycolatopsis benzoatilytica]
MADKDKTNPGAQSDDLAGLTDDELRKRGRAPDPVLPGESAPKATPPKQVHVAFVLAIIASVITIAGQVVTLFLKSQLIEQALKQPQQPGHTLTREQITANANTLVWAMLVGALCFAALLVLFAWKAREGTRSARSIATLLAIVGIVFQLGLIRSIFALTSSAALIAMLVLLYLPKVAGYFPKVGKKL